MWLPRVLVQKQESMQACDYTVSSFRRACGLHTQQKQTASFQTCCTDSGLKLRRPTFSANEVLRQVLYSDEEIVTGFNYRYDNYFSRELC